MQLQAPPLAGRFESATCQKTTITDTILEPSASDQDTWKPCGKRHRVSCISLDFVVKFLQNSIVGGMEYAEEDKLSSIAAN